MTIPCQIPIIGERKFPVVFHPPGYARQQDIWIEPQNKPGGQKEDAVSPVVGVMLLLTITIILAAIISGVTSGIAGTPKHPPQIVFDANLNLDENNPIQAFLDITIISVSEGIPSRDVKIQTEWRDDDNTLHQTGITPHNLPHGYPLGFGPGITTSPHFGNYTIIAGTRMHANATQQGLQTLLGSEWETIREGTPVTIRVIHDASRAIIAQKQITAGRT